MKINYKGCFTFMVRDKKMWLFALSSLFAFCVDYTLFNLAYYFMNQVIIATISARAISASINYLVNKKYVFKSNNKNYNFKNYVILAISILLMNCILIYLLVNIMKIPAYTAKIMVEIILYCISYIIQSDLAHKD